MGSDGDTQGGVATVREVLVEEQEAYSAGEDRPLGQYVRVMGVYAAAITTTVMAARRRGHPVPDLGAEDLAVMALATHKLAGLVSRDAVTNPLRAPFVRYRGVSGPAQLSEEARGTGLRRTVGELVTCPFCVSQWVATAITAGQVFAPRPTKLVTSTFAVLALSDFAQLARGALTKAAS